MTRKDSNRGIWMLLIAIALAAYMAYKNAERLRVKRSHV
jgi:hypothetical protein